MPGEHAWVVLEDVVIDFTFGAIKRKARRSGLAVDTRDALYLGLEVPRSFLLCVAVREEAAGPIALSYSFPASG